MQFVFGTAQDTRWSIEVYDRDKDPVVLGRKAVSASNSWIVDASNQIVWSGNSAPSWSHWCMSTDTNTNVPAWMPRTKLEDRDGWMVGCWRGSETQKHTETDSGDG